MTAKSEEGSADTKGPVFRVISRSVRGHEVHIRLDDGRILVARRFVPIGKGDVLALNGASTKVLAKKDARWIEIGTPWTMSAKIDIAGVAANIQFKEIETAAELAQFDELRKFHYRGGGGAGRTVPIIAQSDLWDLPALLGFVEISSSMIANTARKRFFDFPFRETGGPHWVEWDRAAAKAYSNIICRISRFVIHPEIRGLGLAKHLSHAVCRYAAERWHYGGYTPRFIEITADMLRYYKFVDRTFAFMGDTEGNEHRLIKDMSYLAKKALSEQGAKGMPQGGGGIMTLQRGYASQLLRYLKNSDVSLAEAIGSLRHAPAALDQKTWEALYKLNRKPKPCYVAGLTDTARKYVNLRSAKTGGASKRQSSGQPPRQIWHLTDITVDATAAMTQSSESRNLQDAFGFVGTDLHSSVIQHLAFDIAQGQVTLVCGASGSGKTLLLEAVSGLLQYDPSRRRDVTVTGRASIAARTATLLPLPLEKTPLDLKGRASLSDFLRVTAHCGLAEPQLFVRPIYGLSSGQRYRLQLALAFMERPSVIIVDNFCEPLDKFTVAAVCRGLRSLVNEFNCAALVATAAYERIVPHLKPDQFILLRRGNRSLVRHGEECEIQKGI